MSDFDYMYENGLVDKAGMPLWDDDKNESLKSNEFYIKLTPKGYLHDNGLTIGSEVQVRKEVDSMEEAYLKVQHDRYNNNDKFAIKVLYEDKFIGYIQKNNVQSNYANYEIINSNCFDEKLCIKDIHVKKVDYQYILCIGEEKENFTNNFEEVENILYRKRNIRALTSEFETIKFILNNVDEYNITDEELDILDDRKATLAINYSTKVLGN